MKEVDKERLRNSIRAASEVKKLARQKKGKQKESWKPQKRSQKTLAMHHDEDFLPSSVTDRPQPEIDHQEVLEEVENEEGGDESVNETTVENYISQPGPSSTLTSIEVAIEMKMKQNELNVTSNERQLTKASSNIVSLTDLTENSDNKTIIGQKLLKIHPLPKCKVVKRQVRAKNSEIISGSPFKKFLEEKKEQELREKEEGRRIKEEKKLKGKGVKRNLDLDGEPKTAKTKKTEGNREMVNGKDEETFCAGCGESFEDCWVQCGQCEQWWHEACSDYCREVIA
ncbi:hypothetical protein J6590_045139 [Homalodisca vitripennis]|nr:hypothetical protein J6590_045139 [Homalodisca vitripennis]